MKYFVVIGILLGVVYANRMYVGIQDYRLVLAEQVSIVSDEATRTLTILDEIKNLREFVLSQQPSCIGNNFALDVSLNKIMMFNTNTNFLKLSMEFDVAIPDTRYATKRGFFSQYRHSLVQRDVQAGLEPYEKIDISITRREYDSWIFTPRAEEILLQVAWLHPMPKHINTINEIDGVAVIHKEAPRLVNTYYDEYGNPMGGAYEYASPVCIYSYPEFKLIARQTIRTKPQELIVHWSDGRSTFDQGERHSKKPHLLLRNHLNAPDPLPDRPCTSCYSRDHEINNQIIDRLKAQYEELPGEVTKPLLSVRAWIDPVIPVSE